MNYLKSLVISFVGVAVMFAFWVFAMCIGPFYPLRPFDSDFHQFLFSLGLLAVAGGIYFVVKEKLEEWEILGMGVVFGAAAGTITSLLVWVGGDVVAEARGGFGTGVLLFLLCIVLVGATSVIFGIAVKNLIFALLRLDFVMVLLSFIVGVSCFFGGISVLAGCFEFHTALGVLVLVGLTGSASAYGGPVLSSNEISDGNGNNLWVVSRNGDGSVTTTDGKRVRRMPDGNYKEY